MCANVSSNNVLSAWLHKGRDLVSLWQNIHAGIHSGHASIRFLLPRSDGISREFDLSPKMHEGWTDIKKWPLRAVIKLAEVFSCMLVPSAFCRACLLGFKTSSKCSHVRLAMQGKKGLLHNPAMHLFTEKEITLVVQPWQGGGRKNTSCLMCECSLHMNSVCGLWVSASALTDDADKPEQQLLCACEKNQRSF